jgi:hypothetical protein
MPINIFPAYQGDADPISRDIVGITGRGKDDFHPGASRLNHFYFILRIKW